VLKRKSMILIVALILILYLRTYKYNNLIDDFVPRSGVLLVLGEKPEHYSFYDKQRPLLATITNVGVFIAACIYIYIIWGFIPALLFAVMPTNVCGVAWTTGNYYMSTVLLTLCAHWFTITFGLIGTIIGMCFYTAALGSTVNAIAYAFILPVIVPVWSSWLMFLPLFSFLFGHRFQTGLKLRKDKHAQIKIESGKTSWTKIFVMTKVTAYYIVLSLWPSRLGFFHEIANYPEYHSEEPNRVFYLSLLLIIVFGYFGLTYNLQATIWWFLCIGVFSQFTTYGQFVAERYMVLANVGFCWLLASFATTTGFPIYILATLWFYKSWDYIRAYKSNLSLFCHSITSFPKSPSNYVNLASHYMERNQKEKAIEPLLVGLKLSKGNSPNLHSNLASCFASVGYFTKALEHTDIALAGCGEHMKESLTKQRDELLMRIEKVDRNKRTLKKYGII